MLLRGVFAVRRAVVLYLAADTTIFPVTAGIFLALAIAGEV